MGTTDTVLPNAPIPADSTLSDVPRRLSSFLRLIAGDWDALERDSQVEPEDASRRGARTAGLNASLPVSGTRFTPEKSSE